jgi:hypothetical protein
VLIRVHERWVEELAQQLERQGPITASGSVMTLPAAVLDLKDWVGDKRKFLSVQYDDWQQVIDDYRQGLVDAGPKLSAHVELITDSIDLLLQRLISSSVAADGSCVYAIDANVRVVLRSSRLALCSAGRCRHSADRLGVVRA